MSSVFDLIAGSYVAIYSRAADPQGALFWANALGYPTIADASNAPADLALADDLGPQFYAASSMAFDALYPTTMQDSDFIDNLYINLGGLAADTGGATFWGNRLTTLEATNSQQVARAIVAAEIAFTLQNFDPNATGDAKVRADTYKNKLAVSEAVVNTGNASFNPASQSPTDPAYLGETDILIGVTDAAASLNVALTQVQAANAANNPGVMGRIPPPLTLTSGVDSPTEGFTTGHGATATVAHAVFTANLFWDTLGSNNTLNTGDNLQATGEAAGRATLEFTAGDNGPSDNPPFAAGVTISGVKTADITNQSTKIAGFQGNVTGLLVENNLSSTAGVQIGGQGQGLNTLLTNINISGYVGARGSVMNSAIFAASKGDATATIVIDIKGAVGSTNAALGGANILRISNDAGTGTTANPNLTYGTWSITSANTANLQLEQDFQNLAGSGVGGAKNLILAGAGDIAVGQDKGADPGHWQLLETIDLSKSTGRIAITGATSGKATQAFATEANDGWLFGSAVGLLDNTGADGAFNLTKVTLGSGKTFLDVSSASEAQMTKLTTAVGVGVTANLTNEIIVKNSVATTSATDTFKNISGFSQLGIDGIGGAIDMKNMPSTIDTIIYQTGSSGEVTINNAASGLTVNTEDNGNNNDLTVNGPTGLNDVFNLIVGNNIHDNNGSVGSVTLNGLETIKFSSVGANTNDTGLIKITPTFGANVGMTINGTKDISIGDSSSTNGGAIVDLNSGGGLNTNNLTITITNSGVTRFQGAESLAGHATLFSGTNAVAIDASKSGGLIMEGGDANFLSSATVAGSVGDNLIGSTTAGNVLGGSIGNDAFSVLNNAGNTIYTNGGKDTVSLLAGGGVDRIAIYGTLGTAGITPGGAPIADASSITTTGDVPLRGWWGKATSAVTAGYSNSGQDYSGLIGDGSATDAQVTVISNFKAGVGGDIIQLGSSASHVWGQGDSNGIGGTALGLAEWGASGRDVTTTSGPATIEFVAAGQKAHAGTDIAFLNGSFSNIQQVAQDLSDGAYNIDFANGFGGGGKKDSIHLLVAWQDLAGNAHISDLAMLSNGNTVNSTSDGDGFVHMSDMVQLTGVQLTSLYAANIQFTG